MKQILLLILFSFFIICCEKSKQVENNSLVGKWKLTESFADPGDGSGDWQPADPARPSYLEFKTDGTVAITPYNIYNAEHYKITSDSTLLFIRSTDSIFTRYSFSKTLLTLYPPCIEGCGQKYIAVH
jgi:hypothetical protein